MEVKREKNKIYFNYLNKASATLSLDENGEFISIDIIKVEHPYRQMGVATMIIDEILDYIRSFFSNYKKVVLNPMPLEEKGLELSHMINFYKKFGFMVSQSEKNSKPYLMSIHL